MEQTNMSSFAFENDRITDGLDIFFWVFNDASSFNPTHWHTAIEIMYIISGEIDVVINGETVTLGANDVYLIDSKVLHSTKSINGNHAILIQIPYSFLLKYIPESDSFHFNFDCHTSDPVLKTKISNLEKIILQMQNVFEMNPPNGILHFNSLLFELLFQLYNNFARKIKLSNINRNLKNFQKLEPILQYTNDNYNTPIRLSDIAKVACFQEEYFCHFFKRNTGITYFQYLNELRFSYICRDLIETNYPLKQLLEMHGFTNYKLFRKMFYKQFHTTPGKYRKLVK